MVFRPTARIRAEVKAMRAAGWSVTRIASKLGVSDRTLVKHCNAELGPRQPGRALRERAMRHADTDAAIAWLEGPGRRASVALKAKVFRAVTHPPPGFSE